MSPVVGIYRKTAIDDSSDRKETEIGGSTVSITVRLASPADATSIAELIDQLAIAMGDSSSITEDYVVGYLSSSGAGVLLAIDEGPDVQERSNVDYQAESHMNSERGSRNDANSGTVAGLIAFSVRPGLYHAADCALIEEFVVAEGYRGTGIGGQLLDALLERLEKQGCAEVSVTTMPDNEGAMRFYKSHGLVDEAVYLEKHFERKG